MSSSVVIPRRAAGAGRQEDWVWPSAHEHGNPSTFVSARNREAVSLASNTGYTGGAVQQVATLLSGRSGGVGWDVIGLGSGAADAGVGYNFDDAGIIRQRTDRLAGYDPLADDHGVHRISCVMAAKLAPLALKDYGFQMIRTGTTDTIILNGAPGFGFQFADLHTVQLLINGPNGLKTYNLTALPFDCTKLHTYEFRIFSATDKADARLRVFIDGQDQSFQIPATSLSWALGTDLPTIAAASNFVGIAPKVINRSSVAANFLYVHELRMIAAETEVDTL